ncbi:hypothetical protein CEXT_546571 [Caerostris extrusa]|uniref:Uncharacterized protein n=2 Tax=Caerostris extrusa TaxID=172846 RepID=A0AAV4Y146_CAEEX|nr:hypothetical protein CEXT_546571 [Caerostris extrusa]
MAEAGESFIYLYLGVVGANKNCVGSMRPDLSDWTSKDFDLHGYARYIKEAENVIRIQKRTRSFLINRMTGAEEESNGHSGEYIDFSPSGPEDPDSMASLDNIPSEAITNSTQRMEKEWKKIIQAPRSPTEEEKMAICKQLLPYSPKFPNMSHELAGMIEAERSKDYEDSAKNPEGSTLERSELFRPKDFGKVFKNEFETLNNVFF